MNSTVVIGRVSKLQKVNLEGQNVTAYNFGIASKEGYGKYERTIFFEASAFAKSDAQEKFYDNVLKVGRKYAFEGFMTTGNPYMKNGTKILPWIFQVVQIGNINNASFMGTLTDDCIVTIKGDTAIVRLEIAVAHAKGVDLIKVIKSGKGEFKNFAMKYLTKGALVSVRGKISTVSYNNAQTQEVVASDIQLLDISYPSHKNNSSHNDSGSRSSGRKLIYDENIPEELDALGLDVELPFS